MGGRERLSIRVRIEFEVEDMDRVLSCVTRSRRNARPGTVRAESEERRTAKPTECSTRVDEAGEELARDEREPAFRAVSSWR